MRLMSAWDWMQSCRSGLPGLAYVRTSQHQPTEAQMADQQSFDPKAFVDANASLLPSLPAYSSRNREAMTERWTGEAYACLLPSLPSETREVRVAVEKHLFDHAQTFYNDAAWQARSARRNLNVYGPSWSQRAALPACPCVSTFCYGHWSPFFIFLSAPSAVVWR